MCDRGPVLLLALWTMVLTRSQQRRLSLIETETLSDDEYWALDAAVRAAEEASDMIPPMAAVLMQRSMALAPLSPGALLGRSAAASASWLPAPEPIRMALFSAQQNEPDSLWAAPPRRHSPQRRLSAPAALQSASMPASPASLAVKEHALPMTARVHSPAGSSTGKAPPPAGQNTLHRFFPRRRSTGDALAAAAEPREAAAYGTARQTGDVNEALRLPDPRQAMRSRVKSRKSEARQGQRRSRRGGGDMHSGPDALQVPCQY